MSSLIKMYHLARADFLERVRRNSFLLVMIATVYAGYLSVPALSAPYNTFVVGDSRGYYNSAWIGTIFGMVVTTLLSLIGFYLIKNVINRDRSTRVGQIIATTPIRKLEYVIGKWLSNISVLLLILGVLTLIALVMQLIRDEGPNLNLWALLAPMWFSSIPILAIVSALGVLFESIPFLSQGLGNVIYFFVWGFGFVGTGMVFISDVPVDPYNDLIGMSRTMADIRHEMVDIGLDPSIGSTDIIVPISGEEITRFWWEGIAWTVDIFVERLGWFTLGVLVAVVAAIPFNRFDPAGKLIRRRKKPRRSIWQRVGGSRIISWFKIKEVFDTEAEFTRLSPLTGGRANLRFGTLFLTELRLMFKSLHWIWYGGALYLFITSLIRPFDFLIKNLLPLIWLWPTFIWGEMGVREKHFYTRQLEYSSAHPLRRQIPARWLAGAFSVLVLSSVVIVRLLLGGEIMHVLALIPGALFVSAFAIALGSWVKSSRIFEITYLLLGFIGLIAKETPFDFIGLSDQALGAGVPWVYLGLTIGLLALAALGRKRNLGA